MVIYVAQLNQLNEVHAYAINICTCFQCLKDCPAENTTISSSNGEYVLTEVLEWPETDISQTAFVKCPCEESGIDGYATRCCWGTLQDVAYWEEPQISQCDLPPTTIELYNLLSVSNITDTA